MNSATSVPDLYCLSPLQHNQCSVERGLAVAPSIDEFSLERGQTSVPADWQPTPQLVLQLSDLLGKLFAPLPFALIDCIHGGGEEQTDCFVDMLFCCDG